MKHFSFLIRLLLTVSLTACSQMDNSINLNTLRDLSEKSGIEMIVINKAEEITKANASRFSRRFIGSSYASDPIKSSIRQNFPKTKTVELPGVSFLVDSTKTNELVDTLNKIFAYRNHIAFVSDNDNIDDNKQTISIIHSIDKYNALRLQETSGGSYVFSTEQLIEKLKRLEERYPFTFIGVGDDWLLLKLNENVTDWSDLAKEVLKVCPNDETTPDNFAKALQDENGEIFMWWD